MADILKERVGEIHLVSVHGEIDAGSSILLDNALKEGIDAGEKKMVVDLSELAYISSAGLGVFISHLDEFEKQDIKLTIFGINDNVRQVFDILGLEKLLTIVNTKEEAIASFE